MKNRLFTPDVGIALLAVAMVIVAFVLANWPALSNAPSDLQAEADTAASVHDAIAAAKVASVHAALPH